MHTSERGRFPLHSEATGAESVAGSIDRDTLNLEELAVRMGISLTVAYELARRDELPVPVIRVGRQYRFSRRAYDALMTGQHPSGDGDAA